MIDKYRNHGLKNDNIILFMNLLKKMGDIEVVTSF